MSKKKNNNNNNSYINNYTHTHIYSCNLLFAIDVIIIIIILLNRWLKGRSLKTRQQGIFPANYTTKKDFEEARALKAPLSDVDISLGEINQTLHQWGNLLSFFVKSRRLSDFGRLKGWIAPLLQYRQDLISTEKSPDEKKIAISKASEIIEQVIKEFALDAVVRHPNKQVASVLDTGSFSLLSMVNIKIKIYLI